MESEVLTTKHVRNATEGNLESLAWIFDRFSPLLFAQAKHHLAKASFTGVDAGDLVSQTWLTALPKLRDFEPRGDRYTPGLVKLLSIILSRHYRDLAKRHLRGKPLYQLPAAGPDSSWDRLAGIPATGADTLKEAMDRERHGAVLTAIEGLPNAQREAIIHREIMQLPHLDAARVLDVEPNVLAGRRRDALQSLRRRLGASIFDELEDE